MDADTGGYCAKEQPLGERCIDCNKRLARSAAGAGSGSRFWEARPFWRPAALWLQTISAVKAGALPAPHGQLLASVVSC
jgi:hypothetical protein